MDADSIDRGIGQRLDQIRGTAGLTDEEIAAGARDLGLPWTRNTVVGIENGKRALNVGEFLLLPLILERAFDRAQRPAATLGLVDLLPTGWVDIGGALIDGDALGALLRGGTLDAAKVRSIPRGQLPARQVRRPKGVELEAVRGMLPAEEAEAARIEREALGDAETKLARSLGTIAELVVLASREAWGRTLSEERDARLEALDVPRGPADDAQTRRRALTALRGHITRELAKQIDRPLYDLRVAHLSSIAAQLGPVAERIVEEGQGKAERRLAGALNTISEMVVLAARDRFGRPASEELEQRLSSVPTAAGPNLRSELSREMARELEEPLAAIQDLLRRGDQLPRRVVAGL